jgi:hypothetical protein
MTHQQLFVRGLKADGSIGLIDVLRLDEASFRAYVLDALLDHETMLLENETIDPKRVRPVGGEAIVYREQVGELLKLSTV